MEVLSFEFLEILLADYTLLNIHRIAPFPEAFLLGGRSGPAHPGRDGLLEGNGNDRAEHEGRAKDICVHRHYLEHDSLGDIKIRGLGVFSDSNDMTFVQYVSSEVILK